jgi:hypothetical protein
MRKVIWGCTVCAVLVIVGVVAAANHAARCPNSVIGRVLHGASHMAARMSPAAGFAEVLARSQPAEPDVIASVEGIPDEPEAVPEQAPAVSEERSSAPIVIPEDDPAPLASVRQVPPATPVAAAPFGAQTECPATTHQAAPATMPYCHEEEECEAAAGETVQGYELLPMPCAEEESEDNLEFTPETQEPPACDKCPEDSACQHHYSGCPFTGQPYPGCPSRACPGKPSTPSGSEEASEPPSTTSSALRKIHRLNMRLPMDESCPMHPEVDTMEYRPSDGSLHDYGPGSL